METKSSSSLAGPLWVIAVGILILGIGACFTGYMLWDGKRGKLEPSPKWPTNSLELRELMRTNPEAFRNRVPTATTKAGLQGGTALDQARSVNLVETASAPGQTNATVVLPPPPRASALPPLSGAALTGLPTGTISGRVRLVGTPPPEKPLPLDAMCGKLHNPAQPPTTRFYVVSPQGGLADVLVYITEVFQNGSFEIATNTPVIDQVGCQFTPHVLSVQVGQPMIVRNSDPLLHNNHFTPTVQGNPEINKAQMPRGADQIYTWSQPEIFLRLKCDVHPWMFAYLGVVEHPFHAVTDTNGVFQFAAPPPGRYVLEAVPRKTHVKGGGGIQREIEVKAGETLKVDFEVTLPL
jgi:hypothetical protein